MKFRNYSGCKTSGLSIHHGNLSSCRRGVGLRADVGRTCRVEAGRVKQGNGQARVIRALRAKVPAPSERSYALSFPRCWCSSVSLFIFAEDAYSSFSRLKNLIAPRPWLYGQRNWVMPSKRNVMFLNFDFFN